MGIAFIAIYISLSQKTVKTIGLPLVLGVFSARGHAHCGVDSHDGNGLIHFVRYAFVLPFKWNKNPNVD